MWYNRYKGGDGMTATISRINENYTIALPSTLMKLVKIKESETVHIFEVSGKIIIQKSDTLTVANDPTRKTIDELFEGYNEDYEPIQIDWGAPVGKELW